MRTFFRDYPSFFRTLFLSLTALFLFYSSVSGQCLDSHSKAVQYGKVKFELISFLNVVGNEVEFVNLCASPDGTPFAVDRIEMPDAHLPGAGPTPMVWGYIGKTLVCLSFEVNSKRAFRKMAKKCEEEFGPPERHISVNDQKFNWVIKGVHSITLTFDTEEKKGLLVCNAL